MKQTLHSLLRSLMRNLGICLLSMAFAVLFRKYLLGALETRIVWVTFYPAVMIAALYGGWSTGLMSAGSSCLIAFYAWPWLAPRPFIQDFGDQLGMFAFLFNCAMISFVAETARRAQARAIEAKEQSEVARELADAANRAKSVFLANMSHELRTPLNAILGFSRLLHNDAAATAEQKRHLNIIARSGEHLLNLINNVLDISKIEAGRVEVEQTATDLPGLLHEMLSLMHFRAVEGGLSVSLELPADLPRQVTVDQGKLRQVLINLLGNAIKFTERGGVVLRVVVVQAAEAGQQARLRFEVADSGPGIGQEDRERIFLPFVQLKERLPAETGTGLGLAISKQYVELMHGTIGVDSEPGHGSLFHVELPVTVAAGEEIPADLYQKRIVGLAAGQPTYRLLIVEDQPENRLLLHELLKPLGFALQEAANGQEAVEIFARWHPHLIWMDIRMPVMDGMEATRRIKATEAGHRTRIVALTAHALEEERQEILAAGCDAIICKPYREVQIFEAMARYLGLSYVYAGSGAAAAVAAQEVSKEQLAALPGDLLQQLHQAVVLLDTARVRAVIEQIARLDAATGDVLARQAARFEYENLLNLLEKADNSLDGWHAGGATA